MRSTLLYDGECRFCRFAARAVIRLDRDQRLAVLPFGDPEAESLLERIPEDERAASWQLVLADGRRATKGRGVVDLLGELQKAPRLARALAALPLDLLYTVVAHHRRYLGRLVPNGPAPRRL
jgi:predicted DCC family thiol-disulfide oxidoreductase YuxK